MNKAHKKVNKQNPGIFGYSVWCIILIWCLIMCLVVYWAVITSFKDSYETRYYPFKLPLEWRFENYTNALKDIKVRNGVQVTYFPELLLNTLIYNIGVPLIANSVICITTYIAARFKHIRYASMLFTIYIITAYMPAIGSTASTIRFMQRLGLYDKWIGVFLMNAGGFGGNFLIYYGAWKAFALTYSEAAQIDGANHLQVFIRIMVPMILPVFFVMTLGTVRACWDDYAICLVYLPSYPNIAYAAYNIINGSYDNIDSLKLPNQIAYYILFAIPMFVIYYASKNRLIKASEFNSGLKG